MKFNTRGFELKLFLQHAANYMGRLLLIHYTLEKRERERMRVNERMREEKKKEIKTDVG